VAASPGGQVAHRGGDHRPARPARPHRRRRDHARRQAAIDGLALRGERQIPRTPVGAIFQDPLTSLNPLSRVGDQIVETIRTHLPRRRRRRASARFRALQEVGISAAAPASNTTRTSSPAACAARGDRACVVAEPRLIIADEPTTALDVSTRADHQACSSGWPRAPHEVDAGDADMGVIAETADRVAGDVCGRIARAARCARITRASIPYARLMGAIRRIGADKDKLAQIDGSMPRLTELPRGALQPASAPRSSTLQGRASGRQIRGWQREGRVLAYAVRPPEAGGHG